MSRYASSDVASPCSCSCSCSFLLFLFLFTFLSSFALLLGALAVGVPSLVSADNVLISLVLAAVLLAAMWTCLVVLILVGHIVAKVKAAKAR